MADLPSIAQTPDCKCPLPEPNGRGECSTCKGFACHYAYRGNTRCSPSICDCFIATHPFDNPQGLHPEAFLVNGQPSEKLKENPDV